MVQLSFLSLHYIATTKSDSLYINNSTGLYNIRLSILKVISFQSNSSVISQTVAIFKNASKVLHTQLNIKQIPYGCSLLLCVVQIHQNLQSNTRTFIACIESLCMEHKFLQYNADGGITGGVPLRDGLPCERFKTWPEQKFE